MKNIATEMRNAASIASAVAAGKISARELLDVSITCIASTDRRVNAFTDLTLARAQKEADAVDAQCARWRQRGNAADKPGPLAGVPYAVKNLFEHWDVLLCAATPVSAPPVGTEWLDPNGTQHPARAAMGLLTQPISFAGCPVVAAPMWPGGTNGMPVGVQIISAPWKEATAFRAAALLDRAGVARFKPVNV